MIEIRTRNVNTALPEALWKLKVMGEREDSRNGPVLVFPEPVMTTYQRPTERVLFWGERDANPIFHLLESIWMMAGRRDVKFPQLFNSKFGQFSDDGVVFNAAYGYRWRQHFGQDQLLHIIHQLKGNPNSRQAVLQIWDPEDLNKDTKDKACNTQAFFEIRHGRLNMTVINRSNDIWWGAYGSNAVHFSVLLEFMASALKVPVGLYRQFSHNLHLYTELYDAQKHLECPPDPETFNLYELGVRPIPLMDFPDHYAFLADCGAFCQDPFSEVTRYYNSFFRQVAFPIAMVSKVRKDKIGDGMYWVDRIQATDWKIATQDWVERREAAKAK